MRVYIASGSVEKEKVKFWREMGYASLNDHNKSTQVQSFVTILFIVLKLQNISFGVYYIVTPSVFFEKVYVVFRIHIIDIYDIYGEKL